MSSIDRGSAAGGDVGRRLLVLVVDDDEMVRDVTLQRLTGLGYGVLGASSGREALEVLSRGAVVDLLLTDIRMADGMQGPDLVKEARRLRPRLKVLFASGSLDDAMVQEGRATGNAEPLVKPFSKARLMERVRTALMTE